MLQAVKVRSRFKLVFEKLVFFVSFLLFLLLLRDGSMISDPKKTFEKRRPKAESRTANKKYFHGQ